MRLAMLAGFMAMMTIRAMLRNRLMFTVRLAVIRVMLSTASVMLVVAMLAMLVPPVVSVLVLAMSMLVSMLAMARSGCTLSTKTRICRDD